MNVMPKVVWKRKFEECDNVEIMDSKTTKAKQHKKIAFLIVSALFLHILSMYLVVFLQNRIYPRYSTLVYMLIKFILRWFYLIVPACFMRIEHIKLKDIGITKDNLFIQIIIGLVLGSIGAITIVGLTILLGFKEQLGQAIYEEGWQYVVYFFYTVFAVGLFEEIFFRGYIYKKLLDIKESNWFAIILSSIIFGLCHFVGNGSFVQSLPQMLLSTIVGLCLCFLRERIRNCTLISLIFLHGTYDFCIAFLRFIL